MGAALVLRSSDPSASQAIQPGELARLKIIQGPDQGKIFSVLRSKILIGRGDENDLVLADLKSSRRHVQLELQGSRWKATDVGSQNGIDYRGNQVRAIDLKDQDHFRVGETWIEFVSVRAGSEAVLAAASNPLALYQADQALEEQRARVRRLGRPGKSSDRKDEQERLAQPAAQKKPPGKKPSPVILILGLGGIAYFGMDLFLPKKQIQPKSAPPAVVDPTIVPAEIPELKVSTQTAEMLFRAGFREYRERNYLRAISNFENVLQIVPQHQLARLYLKNAEFAIQEEVSFHLGQGKKSIDAGKIKSARAHFEAILRLLYRTLSDPRAVDAREQLEKVNGMQKGQVER